MRSFAVLEGLLIAAAVLLLLGPSIHFPFLPVDDDYVIERNPYIAGGLPPEGAPELPRLAHDQPVLAAFAEGERFWMGSEYVPLSTLSLWIDGRLCGRQAWGFRLTAIILSLISAWLFHSVLRRLLGISPREFSPAAFLAGLWFALHPLHMEAQLWPAMRKDLLAAAFGLAAWDHFTRFFERGRVRDYGLGLVLFAAAMLSKVTAVFLAPLWLLQAVLQTTQTPLKHRQKLALAAPLFAVALADMAIAISIGRSEGIVASAAPPLSQSLLTDLSIAFHYLRQSLIPLELNAFYFWPDVKSLGAETAVAALIFGFWALVGLAERRRHPLLSLAVGFSLLSLVPVLNFLPKTTRAADRYAYFLTAGIALGLGYGLHRALEKFRENVWPRRALLSASAAIVVALSVQSWRRVQDFSTPRRFAEAIVQGLNPAPQGHIVLAKALADEGDWDAALAEAERAKLATLHPNLSPEAHLDARLRAAEIKIRRGELKAAREEYLWILRRHPEHPVAAHNARSLEKLIAKSP